MKHPPFNLIFITADEMRADCAGFMGQPLCPTPHLDLLAKQGVVFENHFSVHGKCVPSRCSMLTGRYPHTDGHRAINHENTIPDGTPNLHLHLKNRGYETAFFGLNHTHENLYTGRNRKGESIADYHSFTEVEFDHFLEREWPVPPQTYFPAPAPDPCHETHCQTRPLNGFCDDTRAEQAVHYLRYIRDRARPFYLHLNLSLPHPPYKVEEPYFSMYDRGLVEPFPQDLTRNAPLPLVKMREFRGGNALTEAAARELKAVYLGMITKVDSLIGRVLQTIEREGLMENSILIFTSDHGDFAGQYGLPEKWDTAMQDCLLHVPFLLHSPGLPRGERCRALSEHVDLAPTILDLLGFEPEPQWGIHGRSLLPTLRGAAGKDFVFAGGGHEESLIRRFNTPAYSKRPDGTMEAATQGKQRTYEECPETMARVKMVRTREWKLVVRLTGGDELYHLPSDPHELNNLHGLPEHTAITAELTHQLLLWCLRTDTDRPYLEKVGA